LMLPGFGNDFLLALGNVGGILLAASSSTAATHLLGLREFALVGIGLNKRDVRAGFRARVFRSSIEADHIAGNEFEIFQGNRGGTVCLLDAFLLEQIYF